MRRAAKVDDNQAEIVQALRDMGATVQSLAATGKGCPDALVGWRGHNLLFEIKDGAKQKSKQLLTSDQERWLTCWNGTVFIVRTVETALRILNDELYLIDPLYHDVETSHGIRAAADCEVAL